MTCDLDQPIDRRHTDSVKWSCYDQDVLPMWVADMDFCSPEPVVRALRERVAHGVFGYGTAPSELYEVVTERLLRLYNWHVSPEALIFLPGVVTGFNLTCRAVASPGEGVLVQTPVYYPILYAPANAGLACDEMELTRRPDGRYVIDFDLFEETITAQTRLFILCNPHNPVGRVFRRKELERMAELCLRHDMIICSDEIHCDLVFQSRQHLPIASLAPEIAERTITLMAPSKTYNIAGLKCSVAVVQNAELREKLNAAKKGLVPGVSVMGYTAALAAYLDGQTWLDEVLRYLEANRDFALAVCRTGNNVPRAHATRTARIGAPVGGPGLRGRADQRRRRRARRGSPAPSPAGHRRTERDGTTRHRPHRPDRRPNGPWTARRRH